MRVCQNFDTPSMYYYIGNFHIHIITNSRTGLSWYIFQFVFVVKQNQLTTIIFNIVQCSLVGVYHTYHIFG